MLSAACPSDTFFETYLAAWQNAHDPPSLPAALPDKQSFWDQPDIQSARAQVEAHYSEPQQTARFLAAATPHIGDWLLALPISSCGLRLSDDAVRVAVALRLGCSVCVAHTCRCGSPVDTHDLPAVHIFQPLAFETHGTTHSSAIDFLNAMGGRSTAVTEDLHDTTFLAAHFCSTTAI